MTEPNDILDLPLRVSTESLAQRRAVALEAIQQREAIMLPGGMSVDPDEANYRRLTGGSSASRRDLNPIQQDRMLEISWFLWEQNPFAKRLISLMTDLILGEGVLVQAQDERLQEQIDLTWNHRINQLRTRLPEFHNALALNGELILPVEKNPVSGRPVIGYIDPYQVRDIIPLPGNILIPDIVWLKGDAGNPSGQKLKIVREDPDTGMLAGECFYLGINKLPNSTRGRSDLLPMADWLDLYDQYLFAEVERLQLLSSFVWDLEVKGGDEKSIKDKLAKFPNPRAGTVYGHNEKEVLTARTPDLKAADRSEAGRMLRTHIAGSYGFPLSYLGEGEGNRAQIEGQNDIMLKTPAARQKVFAGFLDQILRFTVEGSTSANPALFRDVNPGTIIRMPEIAAKDVSRIGAVLSQVVSAMDVAMNNQTATRRLSVTVMAALLKHLGVDVDPQDVMDEADAEAQDKQEKADLIASTMARKRATNPPVPGAVGNAGGPQATGADLVPPDEQRVA